MILGFRKRSAAGTEKARRRLSQLVMWHLAGGLDWNTIAQLSEKWANDYELTLAKDFVERLERYRRERRRLLFQVTARMRPARRLPEVSKALQGKKVLGLVANGCRTSPTGGTGGCMPSEADGGEASVQVMGSDAA